MILTYRVKKPASIKDFLKENNIPLKLICIEKNKFQIHVGQELRTIEDTIRKGDTITICIQNEDIDPKIVAEPMTLDILYEDEYLLIVNKPFNQAMMISKSQPSGTLANGIAKHYEERGLIGRIHFVNRVDKEAVGIVVVAKHRFIKYLITENEQHPFRHEHQAILDGNLENKEGTIDLPVGKRSEDALLREVFLEGEECQTVFRVVQDLPKHTLVKILSETGRVHQIRVHFAYFNLPIVGDPLYNPNHRVKDPLMLFSSKVLFKHPISTQNVDIEIALPDEFRTFIKQNGGSK
jgi:23S rRNA pseudouridine1911/1915/1917 synthase